MMRTFQRTRFDVVVSDPWAGTAGAHPYETVLTRLAMNDEAYVESLLDYHVADAATSTLDGRTCALVRLGALLALDAASASYSSQVAMALAAGATADEIVEVLLAVAPSIGVARVVSAAPELALALGFDVEDHLDHPPIERDT
jgi:4-carboxymuconolactone decarboxylase